MRGQHLVGAFVAYLCLSLAACSGGAQIAGNSSSGGTSGSTSGGTSSGGATQTPAHIGLTPSSNSLDGTNASSSVTFIATVTDANNLAVGNATVSLKASSGALVVSGGTGGKAATDGNGNVSATLTDGGVATPRTITVTATVGTLSATASITVTAGPSLAMGTLGTDGTFTAGAIAIGAPAIAAGGTSTLQVSIVDTANNNAPYTSQATVTFSSPCVSTSNATIASPVTASTGTFNSTYTASGCSGTDDITANALVNGVNLTATGSITIQAQALGSIQFISATPTSVGLRGTGLPATSVVIFKVLDPSGSPVKNRLVDFSLSTTAGGMTILPNQGTTAADGTVQTTVQAGTVHTPVTVTAVVDGTSLSTQSSQLSVSTGIPTQGGFSLAATSINLRGNDVVGNTSTITAQLSDRYQNPVLDGTTVNFTTECGQVDPQCQTTNGSCSVTFRTGSPLTGGTGGLSVPGSAVYTANNCSANNHDLGCDDHRCTVLAYAIGEESFIDCHATGLYSSATCPQSTAGDFFVSLPELWRDDNESCIYNPTDCKFNGAFETFEDFNNNHQWDTASGKFIGLLCNDPNCDPNQNTLYVGKSLVLVMTSDALGVSASMTPPKAPVLYATTTNPNGYVLPASSAMSMTLGSQAIVYVQLYDSAGQLPPVGSTVNVSLTSGGSIVGPSTFTMPNSNGFGYLSLEFVVQAPATSKTNSDFLDVTWTTPAVGTNAALTGTAQFLITYK